MIVIPVPSPTSKYDEDYKASQYNIIINHISLELLQLYEHLFVDQPFLANDIQLEEPEQLSVVVVQ